MFDEAVAQDQTIGVRRDGAGGMSLQGASALGPAPDFAFSPSPTDAFTAGLGFSKEGTTATATIRPGRFFDIRELWPIQIASSTTTDKNITTIGASVRLEYRWLAPDAYARDQAALTCVECQRCARGELGGECQANLCANGRAPQPEKAASVIDLAHKKAAYDLWWNLLPVVTIGGDVTFFFVDATADQQRHVAKLAISPKLDWRLGTLFEAQGTLSFYEQVNSNAIATEYGSVWSASGTAVFVLPWLVGAEPLDDYAMENGFQQGIGLGVAYTHKNCREEGARRSSCENTGKTTATGQVTEETFLGGILDVRITKELRPRLTIGSHQYDVYLNGNTFTSSGAEISVQAVVIP